MNSKDYEAKLTKDRRNRLEKTSLAILAGFCACPETEQSDVTLVKTAIQMATEFIIQIDREKIDEDWR